MGTNKLLLELDGETLIRRAVGRARRAGLSPIIVVLGHEVDRVREELAGVECTIAVNPDPSGPMSASMHIGLRQLAPSVGAAMAILPDMTRVTAEMLRDVADGARAGDAPLVVSKYGDVTAPPILYRRALFNELLAWSGEGCGKPVVQRHINEAVVKDWPAAALSDIDTPEDYATARAARS